MDTTTIHITIEADDLAEPLTKAVTIDRTLLDVEAFAEPAEGGGILLGLRAKDSRDIEHVTRAIAHAFADVPAALTDARA